jgi:glutaredoxin
LEASLVNLTVYSTPTCPRCEQLKAALKKAGLSFSSQDMSTPQALTELRVNGVFTLMAPVLQADESFYTVEDLFEGEVLRDLSSILKS